MYNLALLNTEQDIVHKMDFTDIIDLFTAAKTRKNCFQCFFLRTCNFGFRFHQFLELKILLLSVQFEKKYSFSIVATFAFSNVIMNTKLRFQVGPGAPNLSGAPAIDISSFLQ